jgi:hypothetical protein
LRSRLAQSCEDLSFVGCQIDRFRDDVKRENFELHSKLARQATDLMSSPHALPRDLVLICERHEKAQRRIMVIRSSLSNIERENLQIAFQIDGASIQIESTVSKADCRPIARSRIRALS